MISERALGPGTLRRRERGSGPATWTLDYRDGEGRRRRVSLGPDKRVAERRRMEIIRQRDLQLSGLNSIEGQSTPLAEIRDLYLEDLVHHVSPGHLKNVKGKLARVLRALGPIRVRDLNTLVLARFRNQLADEGLSHRTCNLHADVVRGMLRWAVDSGLIAKNPVERIRRLPEGPKHTRKKRRALSEVEVQAFLEAARLDDLVQRGKCRGIRVPQAPFWRAAIETGARYGELRGLCWADVDLEQQLVLFRAETTKAGRERLIPITEAMTLELLGLRQAQERVLGVQPDSVDRVFLGPEGKPLPKPTTNAMRIFDRLLAAAGIEREDGHGRSLDIHALRGTAATRLARAGVAVSATQHLLGHSDARTTLRHYVHVGVEELRGAVEAVRRASFHPRLIAPAP